MTKENAVTATITAENQFTDWISPKKILRVGLPGKQLNLSISGNSTAIEISIQRTFDGGTTIYDVPTSDFETYIYTVDTEQRIEDIEERVQYRVGCKTGGFTSGTCSVRLGA